jgi:uncharacterized RmlC-like cupin family protein
MIKPPPDRPIVIPSDQASSGSTTQTEGIVRTAAISQETMGSTQLWFGFFRNFPGQMSGKHHHAQAETAGYIVKGGPVRVYYGEDYQEFVEARAGDFIYIPAWIPHYEVNVGDEEGEGFMARSPGNIVVPL